MSLAISPTSGRLYGVARVCRVWGTARATLCRHRLPPRPEPLRRGGAVRCLTRVGRPRGPRNHGGTIIPDTVDAIWGTDMTNTWTGEG